MVLYRDSASRDNCRNSSWNLRLSIIRSSPELDVQAIQSLNQPSILYDDQGNFMDNVITREQRYVVKSEEIPDNLKKAFVAIEDERFYEHKGIDIKKNFWGNSF